MTPQHPPIEPMTLADFIDIRKDLAAFWGNRSGVIESSHHPVLIHEFGKTAYVLRIHGEVAAYLMGMLPFTSDTAYVQLIAVKPAFRKNDYGRRLYDHFIGFAKPLGFRKVRATTRPENLLSIQFHQKIGMGLLGEKNEDGVPVVKDYAGLGEDRVVFEMEI